MFLLLSAELETEHFNPRWPRRQQVGLPPELQGPGQRAVGDAVVAVAHPHRAHDDALALLQGLRDLPATRKFGGVCKYVYVYIYIYILVCMCKIDDM